MSLIKTVDSDVIRSLLFKLGPEDLIGFCSVDKYNLNVVCTVGFIHNYLKKRYSGYILNNNKLVSKQTLLNWVYKLDKWIKKDLSDQLKLMVDIVAKERAYFMGESAYDIDKRNTMWLNNDTGFEVKLTSSYLTYIEKPILIGIFTTTDDDYFGQRTFGYEYDLNNPKTGLYKNGVGRYLTGRYDDGPFDLEQSGMNENKFIFIDSERLKMYKLLLPYKSPTKEFVGKSYPELR